MIGKKKIFYLNSSIIYLLKKLSLVSLERNVFLRFVVRIVNLFFLIVGFSCFFIIFLNKYVKLKYWGFMV